MKGIDEETVVGKARAGSLSAFQALVEQHSRDVFRLAFRITGNEMDAEVSATKQAVLRAVKKLRKTLAPVVRTTS